MKGLDFQPQFVMCAAVRSLRKRRPPDDVQVRECKQVRYIKHVGLCMSTTKKCDMRGVTAGSLFSDVVQLPRERRTSVRIPKSEVQDSGSNL